MPDTNGSLPTAGLLVIKDNRLLLAYSRNKQAWYLPGGKIDSGETALESIHREIREELNLQLKPDLLQYYCHITALAYGEERLMMEQECYLYELLDQKIVPGNEIAAVQYFDRETYLQEPAQVEGVLKAFDKLEADQLLH